MTTLTAPGARARALRAVGAVTIGVFALAVMALLARPARAHTTGESFFVLRPHDQAAPTGTGVWELALRDLDDALVIDRDGDGRVTAAELAAREADVTAYALARVHLATPAGPCVPRALHADVTRRAGAGFLAVAVELGCPIADQLTFTDRLFFDRDGLHRAFVTLEDGAHEATVLLRAEQTATTFSLAPAARPSTLTAAAGFVREGILHIWQGLDHVLFLVVLLLPAVLRRRPRGQAGFEPAPSLRVALADVVRVVTAFTAAHSITLALAALGALRAAPRIIEPAIAASVVLAAANNLVPLFGRDRWVVAFALGLLHGFGFSSVLAEIGLPRGHLVAALFGFNLGVEIGQLALVAIVVPLSFWARRTVPYRRFALLGGSAAAAAVAGLWFVERVFGVSLLG